MTRQEQQEQDKRYRDWYVSYAQEIAARVKHWGDKRKRGIAPKQNVGELDISLFEPGR